MQVEEVCRVPSGFRSIAAAVTAIATVAVIPVVKKVIIPLAALRAADEAELFAEEIQAAQQQNKEERG